MSGPTGPLLTVVGRDANGVEVERFPLGHGDDPVLALARLGWAAERPDTIETVREPHELAIAYRVHPVDPGGAPSAAAPIDGDLSAADRDAAVPYQRAAAYAIVTSERGILLTELSRLTNAAGKWNLPGGGIDPGEAPVDTVHREVWEETGQKITDVALLEVATRHWVGRSPTGRVEDFHAVRIVHSAHCPSPTEPVIHDLHGSTSAAAWYAWESVASVPLVESFAALVRDTASHRLG